VNTDRGGEEQSRFDQLRAGIDVAKKM